MLSVQDFPLSPVRDHHHPPPHHSHLLGIVANVWTRRLDCVARFALHTLRVLRGTSFKHEASSYTGVLARGLSILGHRKASIRLEKPTKTEVDHVSRSPLRITMGRPTIATLRVE